MRHPAAFGFRALLIAPACLISVLGQNGGNGGNTNGRIHDPDPHKTMRGCELYEEENHTPTVASASAGALVSCVDGDAGGKSCLNIDEYSFIPVSDLDDELAPGSVANDCWGWTSSSGREIAIVGMTSGTAFVEITNPLNPVRLGGLLTHTSTSSWRDIKVYNDHAFIVSEAAGHGMQVIDLNKVLDVSSPPQTLTADAHYTGFSNAHNIAINEETGYAYAVGTNTCGGGLHMINVGIPQNPVSDGCFSSDGYTHDVQCVTYQGPDTTYVGREICFACNEDTVTVVDVTDKTSPTQISRTQYSGSQYTHQGWLTEDHRHFVFGDELDEYRGGSSFKTQTLVLDVSLLSNPSLLSSFQGTETVIDHNQYIKGNLIFQANYRAGIQVYKINDISDPATGVQQVAYFDTSPQPSTAQFNGAWSNFPFYPSGKFIVSDVEEGLYVLGFSPGFDATSAPTISNSPTSSPEPTSMPSLIPTTVCNNDGICDPGENCQNCGNDCASQTRGNPRNQYCCDGTLANNCGHPDCSCTPQCTSGPECDDGDECTDDICNGGICENPFKDLPPPSCSPPVVCNNNGTCEQGEDCNNCSTDCRSQTGGKKADRYCCDGNVAGCTNSACNCDTSRKFLRMV